MLMLDIDSGIVSGKSGVLLEEVCGGSRLTDPVIVHCDGESSCANDAGSILTVDVRETKDVQHQ